MSPFDSESRMAAQLAPLTTVELMPYFLKRPFSCATTMGEQSVRAIIPNRRSVISGFVADPGTAGLLVAAEALVSVLQPLMPVVAPASAPRPTAPIPRTWRRDTVAAGTFGLLSARRIMLLEDPSWLEDRRSISLLGCFAMSIPHVSRVLFPIVSGPRIGPIVSHRLPTRVGRRSLESERNVH